MRRRGDAWTLQAYAGRDPSGKRRYRTRTVRGTKAEAETALAVLVAEVAAVGPRPKADRLTVADLVAEWLAARAPDWSPSTLAANTSNARHVTAHLGDIPLDRLTGTDIDDLYETLRRQLKPRTVRRVHTAVVHPALNRAVRRRYIAHNPATGAELPTLDDDEIVVPTPEVVDAIIACAGDVAGLLRLAATIGARRSTLAALRWGTVDLDAGTIRFERALVHGPGGLVEKANKGRRAFAATIGAATVAQLAAHRRAMAERALAVGAPIGDRSYVWSPAVDLSSPYRPDGVSWRFEQARDAAGHPEVNLHRFKHFAVTRMLTAGVPPHVVAQRTGTTEATTRRVYAHWIPGADRQAAEVMDRILA